jgi:hypothetical protein
MNDISRLKTNHSNGKFTMESSKEATEKYIISVFQIRIEYVFSNYTRPPSDPDMPP